MNIFKTSVLSAFLMLGLASAQVPTVVTDPAISQVFAEGSVAVNPADLRNGWYPNFPAVDVSQAAKAVKCLVAAGVPAKPLLTVRPVSSQVASGWAPAELVFSFGDKSETLSAFLVALQPEIAFGDLAHQFPHLRTNFTRDNAISIRRCATAVPAPPPPVEVSPIGEAWPDKCFACYRPASAQDSRPIGSVYFDGVTTFVKRRGWNAFIPFAYWERQ